MGTITPRKRKDGSIGYTAQIRRKEKGKVVYTEAETFDREAAARAWMEKREKALAAPGALESAKQEDPPLKDVIDRYVREDKKGIGRTKTQVLNSIKAAPIGSRKCSTLKSPDYVDFARSLNVQPQTVSNYISHLAAVVRIARPGWGYPLDEKELDDAMVVLRRLGMTDRSRNRDRRPTPDELDRILTYYTEMETRGRATIPMRQIIVYAMFSTRRQEEITRIRIEDFEGDRQLVRDMKHPGQKKGNDTWCDVPPEAARIVEALRPASGPIFPYNHRSISDSFTDACAFLGIEDLKFHDLRHEGASRLFEMGWNIPHVAAVTGHRSWISLKRYTHLRHSGDRWAGWKWLDRLAPRKTEKS
ncbi:tyrosine-type recombinase/integrase [Burkholderia cepacia]|uniref:Integrase n=1 Tax=Burkholderia cepacia TaxID=292 RepID=A0ABN5CXW4_BURCE|nr:tyrosine-type recombinase/integrase [Burkholderia cepacia]AIO23820.1 phage integrase family protein [Burkholderia cepacia ATCC 25416]ALK18481.1 chorismate mutase [Burkholderia cepacia ATCC 25416]ASE96047.1 integrase [Burkholderia cepacia]ATF78950.1 integrase [Burkholderia cepacia]MCA8466913.1 tyrosine-type recombinase/integrase [Burkholderia cepacia]